MWQIIALILLPFCWILIAAANKKHRDETGVNGPSRGQMRNIRRRARKNGISENDAYLDWLARKQKSASADIERQSISSSIPTIHDPEPDLAECVAEAITTLGYIRPEAAKAIQLSIESFRGDSPRALGIRLRKIGQQLSTAEKTSIGLTRGTVFSDKSLAMLTDKGRFNPVYAIEATIDRASGAYWEKYSIWTSTTKAALMGGPFHFSASARHPDECTTCRHINSSRLAPDQIPSIPHPYCGREVCTLSYELKFD